MKLIKILLPADLLVGEAEPFGNLKSKLICKIDSKGFCVILKYNFQFTSLSSVLVFHLPFFPSMLFEPRWSHQHEDAKELQEVFPKGTEPFFRYFNALFIVGQQSLAAALCRVDWGNSTSSGLTGNGNSTTSSSNTLIH